MDETHWRLDQQRQAQSLQFSPQIDLNSFPVDVRNGRRKIAQKTTAANSFTFLDDSDHQIPTIPRLSHRNIWDLMLLICSTVLFVATAWFANSTLSLATLTSIDSRLGNAFHFNVSFTLAVLRALEAFLSLSAGAMLNKTLETLQWALTSRNTGVGALCHLGVSPSTSFLGTVGLAFSRYAKLPDRLATIPRMMLSMAIWISGIVLFVDTKLETVYEPVLTYNVTAGVGKFNGSYIPNYLQSYQTTNSGYNYTVLPLSILVSASTLVSDLLYTSVIETISCGSEQVCQGVLMSGGLSMTTPWPPTNFTSSPMITVKNIPVSQIDFMNGIREGDSFVDSEDCTSFGGSGYLIGIKFCLARSKSSPGSLFAGIFVCQEGVHGDDCWTASSPPQITTTFSVYYRHASITTSRSNLTVLSVDEVSEPIQDLDLDVEALNLAFNWLLNFTAANVAAPTSIAEYFWAAQNTLESDYWSIESYRVFHSLLAFPLYLFNPNNYGNTQLTADNITYTLPEDFYTTAAVSNPYEKIAVNRLMFTIFCVLQSLVIGSAWIALTWIWVTQPRLFETSSYPLYDFATKTRFTGDESSIAAATGNREIRKVLRTARVIPDGWQHDNLVK